MLHIDIATDDVYFIYIHMCMRVNDRWQSVIGCTNRYYEVSIESF